MNMVVSDYIHQISYPLYNTQPLLNNTNHFKSYNSSYIEFKILIKMRFNRGRREPSYGERGSPAFYSRHGPQAARKVACTLIHVYNAPRL